MQVCYVESFKEIYVEKDSEEVFKTMVQKFLCEKSIELDQIIRRSEMMLQELEEKKISFKEAKAAAHLKIMEGLKEQSNQKNWEFEPSSKIIQAMSQMEVLSDQFTELQYMPISEIAEIYRLAWETKKHKLALEEAGAASSSVEVGELPLELPCFEGEMNEEGRWRKRIQEELEKEEMEEEEEEE